MVLSHRSPTVIPTIQPNLFSSWLLGRMKENATLLSIHLPPLLPVDKQMPRLSIKSGPAKDVLSPGWPTQTTHPGISPKLKAWSINVWTLDLVPFAVNLDLCLAVIRCFGNRRGCCLDLAMVPSLPQHLRTLFHWKMPEDVRMNTKRGWSTNRVIKFLHMISYTLAKFGRTPSDAAWTGMNLTALMLPRRGQ